MRLIIITSFLTTVSAIAGGYGGSVNLGNSATASASATSHGVGVSSGDVDGHHHSDGYGGNHARQGHPNERQFGGHGHGHGGKKGGDQQVNSLTGTHDGGVSSSIAGTASTEAAKGGTSGSRTVAGGASEAHSGSGIGADKRHGGYGSTTGAIAVYKDHTSKTHDIEHSAVAVLDKYLGENQGYTHGTASLGKLVVDEAAVRSHERKLVGSSQAGAESVATHQSNIHGSGTKSVPLQVTLLGEPYTGDKSGQHLDSGVMGGSLAGLMSSEVTEKFAYDDDRRAGISSQSGGKVGSLDGAHNIGQTNTNAAYGGKHEGAAERAVGAKVTVTSINQGNEHGAMPGGSTTATGFTVKSQDKPSVRSNGGKRINKIKNDLIAVDVKGSRHQSDIASSTAESKTAEGNYGSIKESHATALHKAKDKVQKLEDRAEASGDFAVGEATGAKHESELIANNAAGAFRAGKYQSNKQGSDIKSSLKRVASAGGTYAGDGSCEHAQADAAGGLYAINTGSAGGFSGRYQSKDYGSGIKSNLKRVSSAAGSYASDKIGGYIVAGSEDGSHVGSMKGSSTGAGGGGGHSAEADTSGQSGSVTKAGSANGVYKSSYEEEAGKALGTHENLALANDASRSYAKHQQAGSQGVIHDEDTAAVSVKASSERHIGGTITDSLVGVDTVRGRVGGLQNMKEGYIKEISDNTHKSSTGDHSLTSNYEGRHHGTLLGVSSATSAVANTHSTVPAYGSGSISASSSTTAVANGGQAGSYGR